MMMRKMDRPGAGVVSRKRACGRGSGGHALVREEKA